MIIKYVSGEIDGKKYKWTSGEEGNSFELFRALFKENEGGHALVKHGGRKLLNSYGKCTRRDDVDEHVTRWLELSNKHATDLA